MNKKLKISIATAATLAVSLFASAASAQIMFYEHDNYQGRTFTAQKQTNNFDRLDFNDTASSIIVFNNNWEVCEHANFGGSCMVLRPGRYRSLNAMNMNDTISSARIVGANTQYDDDSYAPYSHSNSYLYDNRRRNNERLYNANVVSVRAVLGTPERRCWIEREQVSSNQSDNNVAGSVVGAILGGVLGHQVGGGRGKDAATIGGAVAGGLLGNNIGRDDNGRQTYSRDVQRCESSQAQGTPEYWDVTYNFRGRQYSMQTTSPPGSTVTVNGRGEPRS